MQLLVVCVNALLIDINWFAFYPFHLNKSHLLVLLHTNDVTFLALVQPTCFTDLVATLS